MLAAKSVLLLPRALTSLDGMESHRTLAPDVAGDSPASSRRPCRTRPASGQVPVALNDERVAGHAIDSHSGSDQRGSPAMVPCQEHG